jgi:hypothetical protein
VAGCGECGDEPSGSCATELVSYSSEVIYILTMVLVRHYTQYFFS